VSRFGRSCDVVEVHLKARLCLSDFLPPWIPSPLSSLLVVARLLNRWRKRQRRQEDYSDYSDYSDCLLTRSFTTMDTTEAATDTAASKERGRETRETAASKKRGRETRETAEYHHKEAKKYNWVWAASWIRAASSLPADAVPADAMKMQILRFLLFHEDIYKLKIW
jgi:hypothetical protein